MLGSEAGFDPILYPVRSLVRIALVLDLDLAFVREKARDALGYYPPPQESLADRAVPRVVSACRPYIPKDEEWELLTPDDTREVLDAYGTIADRERERLASA